MGDAGGVGTRDRCDNNLGSTVSKPESTRIGSRRSDEDVTGEEVVEDMDGDPDEDRNADKDEVGVEAELVLSSRGLGSETGERWPSWRSRSRSRMIRVAVSPSQLGI